MIEKTQKGTDLLNQGLSESQRKAVHDFALAARERFTQEAREQLEGLYGVHADGTFEELEALPALADPEKRATYNQLRRFLEDEYSAGMSQNEAVDKLVKEVAFTHLNRLVAFKMMETRKLIRETVSRGPDSNGFKFYLAEHRDKERLWRGGNVERAYRSFLIWQAAQISEEVRILFEPEDLVSQLFPRAAALMDILEMINSSDLTAAWSADETIGWIYQYFNEPELQAAFGAVSKGAKFEAEDIASATQLFTPRWIVRFLVENTLGRLWIQMHPDTILKERLPYLVPSSNDVPFEPLRPVKDITLMDPACGSMHFGLVAFDLFAEMYREELMRKGQEGWPEEPSVASEGEIPASIIKNNLFGIDIDLRSIQLSALTLYLKAKSLNPDVQLSEHNLACADILTLDGGKLGAFLREMDFRRPIYERLMRNLWEKLQDIRQLGSLLRLERDLRTLIEAEKERYEREGRQFDMFRDLSEEFEEEAAEERYWEILSRQMIEGLEHFAIDQAEDGRDERFFTGEALKGLRILDLLLRRYDVVVTNPPYMSRRKMNKTLADLIAQEYPEGKGDLYAAFILRNLELVRERGWVGMLTMHSFMFISSYEKLRRSISDEAAIQTMAHLGPGLFATGNPGTLQTTSFVLRREQDAARRESTVGTYFRLVHEQDAETKRRAFENALEALCRQEENA